jgi:hypothetical protein
LARAAASPDGRHVGRLSAGEHRRFAAFAELRGRGHRRFARLSPNEAEQVFGLLRAGLAEKIRAQEVTSGRGLHHALDTTAPPPSLDEPHETDVLQLTYVVAQALTRQAQSLGQRTGGGRFP